MITMTIIAQVKPEKQEEFLQTIRSLNSKREEEKGLKKTTLYQEMSDPNAFRLIAEWETQKDLERYLGAEKFRVLLGALEILCKESEIRYSQKAEDLPKISETQPLLPESSWRKSLVMMQEEGKDILKEKKEK